MRARSFVSRTGWLLMSVMTSLRRRPLCLLNLVAALETVEEMRRPSPGDGSMLKGSLPAGVVLAGALGLVQVSPCCCGASGSFAAQALKSRSMSAIGLSKTRSNASLPVRSLG